MNTKSLILYISIICLNSLLFLPLLFTYFLLVPLHILIYWLSFDRIISTKNFSLKWSNIKFSGIASIAQLTLILFLLFLTSDDGLADLSIIFLVVFILTSVEFLILYFTYSKYYNKKLINSAGG